MPSLPPSVCLWKTLRMTRARFRVPTLSTGESPRRFVKVAAVSRWAGRRWLQQAAAASRRHRHLHLHPFLSSFSFRHFPSNLLQRRLFYCLAREFVSQQSINSPDKHRSGEENLAFCQMGAGKGNVCLTASEEDGGRDANGT